MAFSDANRARYVTATFLDAAGETTTRQWQVDSDWVVGAALVNLLALVTLLNGMSDAVVINVDVKDRYYDDAAPAVSPNPSNVLGDAAILTVALDSAPPGKKGTLNIPAPAETIFVSPTGAGRNIIDITDAAVTGFVALFESDAATPFYLSDGETALPANALISGRRTK